MNSIKLKVCGMRAPGNILEVAGLGLDYMGFIFYERSPRYVGEHFVMPDVPPSVKRVGVFVNEATETILEKARQLQLQYIQLHGNESVRKCATLKENNLKVIKVFSVDDQFDFEQTRPYRGIADFFLFDTKGKYYGGNAIAFDWSVLQQYDQELPFFLSGGIGVDNIQSVSGLKQMNLHAVDVNSGVEVSPALKDIAKIRAITQFLNSKS